MRSGGRTSKLNKNNSFGGSTSDGDRSSANRSSGIRTSANRSSGMRSSANRSSGNTNRTSNYTTDESA